MEAQLVQHLRILCSSLLLEDFCIDELVKLHEILQCFLVLLVQQVLLSSYQVCILEIRKLLDAVANGFEGFQMFSCSLLSDAHQYLAHFCLASCWVFAPGLHVHLEKLI